MNDTILIADQWQPGANGHVLPVINPAYGTILSTIAQADEQDIDAAVQAAKTAFPAWSTISGRERATILRRASEIFRDRYLTETARLLTQENGKPLNDSIKECTYAADVIAFYAEESRRITGTHFAGDLGATHSFVLKEPVGVVAAIVPWNFPVDLLAWKLGPGLAAGCTFVIKPSEEAPLATLKFVQAFLDAGLPTGVLNVVTGDGKTGAALVQHPDVQKIAFTGSVGVGAWIAEQAGRAMKRTTLELGGSAPFIVWRDADLDAAVAQSARRAFSHTGQICISVNRILVHESLFDAFVEKFAALTSRLRVTPDGLREPNADMGPMMNAQSVNKVDHHVQDAVQHGASVLMGGDRLHGAEYADNGYFYAPTVLVNLNQDMLVMREETFGPVAPIVKFNTLAEAIAIANSTPYGLAAYLYANDVNVIYQATRGLKFGGIGVNVNDITDIRGPFGGTKMSGIGRELGEVGLDSYLETKHIRLAYRTATL
ncbi:MAG: NAD-dependent succinate-semialdehyde dehydrogenase [Anaerolineae bacterium]|nr:NAD-dependent succinate-semialdehyde dehydrogenase [Anaerolineae bacterium]